jgi:hypothetical protein
MSERDQNASLKLRFKPATGGSSSNPYHNQYQNSQEAEKSKNQTIEEFQENNNN